MEWELLLDLEPGTVSFSDLLTLRLSSSQESSPLLYIILLDLLLDEGEGVFLSSSLIALGLSASPKHDSRLTVTSQQPFSGSQCIKL